jgi:PST family polysaccharide transporter
MAVLPYLVRVLGMETYGLVAFSQAFAQYFVIFTDYGFNLSATRFVAQNRDSPAKIRSMFWTVLILRSSLMLVGIVLLLCIVAAIPRMRSNIAYFLLAYLTVAGNVLFPQWYFQGMEKMRQISLYTGIAKVASAALLFAFVRGPRDGLLAVGLLSGGMLAAGVMGTIAVLRTAGLRYEPQTFQGLRDALVEGWHMFLTTASISLYTNTNVVLVGLIGGNIQAGYFSAAEKLTRAIAALVFPFLQAAYPHISRLIQTSREGALLFYRKTVKVGGACALAIGMALLLFASPIARIAFGSASGGIAPVLRVISAFPILAVITGSMGMLLFIPMGLEKGYSRLLLLVGVLNVLLGCALIPFFGAVGAASGMILMETFQMLGGWRLLKRSGINLLAATGAPA